MESSKKWFNGIYIQEAGFFVAMFILTMLHEWMKLDTIPGFFKGLAFFMILYTHAQIHRFFIFPLFLKKRFILYSILAFLSTLIGALILYGVNYYWLEPAFYQEIPIFNAIIYHFVTCIISTITIMSFFLIRQYSIALQRRSQDQLLLNDMSIKFLHAQLNPHFFFNMLNNLYGVSLSEPSRTPGLIVKLSDLMRYQLENGNKTSVYLMEEITFIKNYIDLERERIGKRCEIKFDYPKSETKINRNLIAPLLLIILIENAFKHSLAIKNPWFVHISIKITDSLLEVDIRNSVPEEALKRRSTGIGLDNFRQRLELLYNGRYEYAMSQGQEGYETLLTLHLNN